MKRAVYLHLSYDRTGAPRASISHGRGKTLSVALTAEQHRQLLALVGEIAIANAPVLRAVEEA